MAPSHSSHSSLAAGSAALGAETRKKAKYLDLSRNHNFVTFAVETFGAWGPEALAFSSEVGARLAVGTGESRSTSFLRQRIDVAIQRGNALAVRGTFGEDVVMIAD